MTLALPIVLLAAYAVNAQSPPPGGPMRCPSFEQIAKDLNLDENQKPEVKRILEEQHAKREAEREQFRASGRRPTREEIRTRMQQDQAAASARSGVAVSGARA
jgi:hypothetical protein